MRTEPAIILYGPVSIQISGDDLKYMHLHDSLSYREMRLIIDYIEANDLSGAYTGDIKDDLEYKFYSSAFWLEDSPTYGKLGLLSPTIWKRFIYMITLGYGYRPERMINWIILIIGIFTVTYYRSDVMRSLIYEMAVSGRKKHEKSTFETRGTLFLSCFEFSLKTFLSPLAIRKYRSFPPRQRFWSLANNVMGLTLIVYVLLGSKTGVISLDTLKKVFL